MRVTIKDVAEHAQVSTATVSRVLNGNPNVKEDLAKRVRKSVAALGYRPNAAARTLKTRKTNTIGILIPDISNPYFMQIAKGIEDIIVPLGFSLLFASSDESSEKERKLLEVFSEKQIDSMVIATAGGNDESIHSLHNSGTPVVLVDRVTDALAQHLDYVVEENYQAAYELTEHFLKLGVGSLGIINGPMSTSTGFERARGFARAIADYGFNPDLISQYYGFFSREDGANAVKEFEEKGMPEAIIAFNNLMAEGAILELRKRHYLPGEDFLLGSYGEIELVQLFSHHFPCIEQEPRKIGIQVAEILVQRLIHDQPGPFIRKFKQPLIIATS